jgi:hypothetical protein
MDFKFFQKPKPKENMYLCYHMDEVLIHVLRYKQFHNVSIIGIDTPFDVVNVPINGFMRINNWRSYDLNVPHMVEIDYSVIETNTTSRNYTFRMATDEFLSLFNTTRI